MQEITIRKATKNDIGTLQHIGRETFIETFGSMNSAEDMKNYINKEFSTEKLTTLLEDENARFYVALCEEAVIGYLKVNWGDSQTEIKEQQGFEIERIYVLKEFHRKKVAQLLYKQAIEAAQEKKAAYVWLGVWEENARAIRFYEKNGFKAFDKHIFKLGNDEQTDIMMKLEL